MIATLVVLGALAGDHGCQLALQLALIAAFLYVECWSTP